VNRPAGEAFSVALPVRPGTPSGKSHISPFATPRFRERSWIRSVCQRSGASVAIAAAGYAALTAAAYFRYGRPRAERDGFGRERLLDRFMPAYEVVERHHIRVHAAAHVTLGAALEQDLQRSAVIRIIFKARAIALGSTAVTRRPTALLAELLSLGWVVLTELPGREVVLGTVTRPWDADVVFRSVPADRFPSFREPGFVKIVVALRADPLGPGDSMFRTETRALATDSSARVRFRRYWSLVSPGVGLIRLMSLYPLKTEAERRAAVAHAGRLCAGPETGAAGG
jgi:hypothetical protein